MVWIYEVLEVHDRRGRALERFRLVRWSDDNPEKVQGLCEHAHDSPDEALTCPIACRILDTEFRERIVTAPRLLS